MRGIYLEGKFWNWSKTRGIVYRNLRKKRIKSIFLETVSNSGSNTEKMHPLEFHERKLSK